MEPDLRYRIGFKRNVFLFNTVTNQYRQQKYNYINCLYYIVVLFDGVKRWKGGVCLIADFLPISLIRRLSKCMVICFGYHKVFRRVKRQI
jgi:hypothetical protein